MQKRQAGFTLIELVIVIVILGILAAAALPRFSDLSTDARVAAINGLAGSIRAAAGIAKSTQLAKGYTSAQDVTLDGTLVQMQAGYPMAETISAALTDTAGFTVALVALNNSVTFTLGGRANCYVNYVEGVVATGAVYTVTVTSSGC